MPRDERDDFERADRLDRYWDEVLRGSPSLEPAAGPDPTSAEVVRRVNDLPAAPGVEAARARVRRRLVGDESTYIRANQNGHVPLDVGEPAATENFPAARTAPRWFARRRPPTVLIAAAVLLAFLGSTIIGPLLYPGITGLWPDPDPPGVPVSRGGPARTGEQPGPGPGRAPVVGWDVQTGAALSASPAVVDGVVYVGTYDRRLLALDAERGAELWSFGTDGAVGGSPAVADGVVYVGDEAGVLYAVDVDSGMERWRVDLGGSLYTAAPVVVGGSIYLTSGAGGTAPAFDDGVVYVGGDGSASRSPLRLHALDVETGQERWRRSVASNGLFALDAATGEERWHVRTAAPIYHSSPVVAEGAVYIGSKDGTVLAVDAGTGQERWRVATGAAVYASPAVVGGTLYVGSTDGFVYALDASTGSQVWRIETGVVRRSSAAVADGVVYVVGGDHLWALDAESGAERWREATGGDGEGSPAVIGGTVYVSGRLSIIGGAPGDAFGVLFALAEEPGR